MSSCQNCHQGGSNMVKCESCGMVWCKLCAIRGIGPYPKQRAENVCPYCNTTGKVKIQK